MTRGPQGSFPPPSSTYMSSSSSSAKPPQGQRPHEEGRRRGRHSEVAHLLPFSMRRNKANKSTSLFCACWSPTSSAVEARGGSAAQRRCPGTGAQWRRGRWPPSPWRARVPAQEPSALPSPSHSSGRRRGGAGPFYMHVLAVRRRRSSKHVAHVQQACRRTRCVWRASVSMCRWSRRPSTCTEPPPLVSLRTGSPANW